MKKKYIYMFLCFVLLIILILGIVIFGRHLEQNDIINKLSSTVWTLIRDEYTSNGMIEFEGEPIIHSNVMINRESTEFCYVSIVNEKDEFNEECVEYKSSINLKKKQLIVYTDNDEIIYTYSLYSDNKLTLTYGDDNFSLIYYYESAMG